MRQGVFVKLNEEKWKSYETRSEQLRAVSTDEVAEMYVHLTEDLAYAKAKFPDTQLYQYLAELTLQVHHHLYRNKPEQKSRFITFWTKELPNVVYESKENLLYAFLIMAIGVAIGALSASNDTGFARLILGDPYVEMTYQNIENGDPMAVYKGHSESSMFFMITINNIRVSFLAFAAGLLFSIGTAYVLFTNGVMIGVFHYLFFSRGLFDETILTIWIHGTLEISAIVIAGAAGLSMGNGLLFPGNFPRMHAFRTGALRGLKIILSLVPFFIVAGFLESVVTRNTHWPLWAKLLIIGVSLIIVIFYLVGLPMMAKHSMEEEPNL